MERTYLGAPSVLHKVLGWLRRKGEHEGGRNVGFSAKHNLAPKFCFLLTT